jgi:hypothetical protein
MAPVVVMALGATAWGVSLDSAIEQVLNSHVAAAKSQAKIDTLSDQASELLSQYRATLAEIESLEVYNKQISDLVGSQEEEMASLREQIDRVTTIGRELTPLMLRMLEALETFVELDVPFLLGERRKRLATLRDMMDRADVTNAEKFRRILEAYQVENEYGRTIEAYKGRLSDKDDRTVDFLRIGRIVLVYKTGDEKEMGVWDQQARAWKALPSSYRTDIKKGLRIALKQAAPDMIRLPLAAAGRAP